MRVNRLPGTRQCSGRFELTHYRRRRPVSLSSRGGRRTAGVSKLNPNRAKESTSKEHLFQSIIGLSLTKDDSHEENSSVSVHNCTCECVSRPSAGCGWLS